jgi:hypothetical protein
VDHEQRNRDLLQIMLARQFEFWGSTKTSAPWSATKAGKLNCSRMSADDRIDLAGERTFG